jgi:hypothetical protein
VGLARAVGYDGIVKTKTSLWFAVIVFAVAAAALLSIGVRQALAGEWMGAIFQFALALGNVVIIALVLAKRQPDS